MANAECSGDFFEADGARRYRCLWDSTIVPARGKFEMCPHCKRPQNGLDVMDVEVRTVREVRVGDFDWQRMPAARGKKR